MDLDLEDLKGLVQNSHSLSDLVLLINPLVNGLLVKDFGRSQNPLLGSSLLGNT
jgi:hypothetical protein